MNKIVEKSVVVDPLDDCGKTKDYKMLIGGRLVASGETMDVIDPATEKVLAQCPVSSRTQLDEAVAAAESAFPAWSALPHSARKEALCAMADVIEKNAQKLARLLTQEQGKPLGEAVREVMATVIFTRSIANLQMPERHIKSEGRVVELLRRPLGVIGAIVPWNFPLAIAAFKVPAALMAGNTVVLKPAPSTPLSMLLLGELIKDTLPAGVLNIVTGTNALGAWMTEHPGIRKIAFTGSTETGTKVMASAAATLKRITLELGGNDAAIVLDDADPKEIAPKIFQGSFLNNDQVCVAIKRLYVHDSIYDALCEELAALANGAVVGNGLEQGTQFGPLQNKVQYLKVRELIDDAKQHGRMIAGGDAPQGPGYFVRPTIMRDIADGTRLVDEEQFGPVLPVIRYFDLEDALARANALSFGLGGSVWSSNPERARMLATRIEAGTVWVNKHGDLVPDIPFGGAKQSGIGIELGEEGLTEFTQIKIINMTV